MPDSTDLAQLVSSLSPVVREGRYAFVTAESLPVGVTPLAMVDEDEGRSWVLTIDDAERLALPFDFVGVWITLTVASPLSAVGLTALVSTALAEAGIAGNVIAGRHHDHLLVPAERSDEAMAVLGGLASRRTPPLEQDHRGRKRRRC